MHLVLDLCVELLCQQSCGVEIDHIVDGVHLAPLHELGNDLTGLLLQTGSQLAHGDLVRDPVSYTHLTSHRKSPG